MYNFQKIYCRNCGKMVDTARTGQLPYDGEVCGIRCARELGLKKARAMVELNRRTKGK